MRYIVGLLVGMLFLAVASHLSAPASQAVVAQIGGRAFRLAVANRDESLRRGLAGQTLCADCGMLFDFGRESPNLNFWMAGMTIDLDMLWVNVAGGVVATAERVPHPSCLDIVACPPAERTTDRAARYVIELPSGTIASLNGPPRSVTFGSRGP